MLFAEYNISSGNYFMAIIKTYFAINWLFMLDFLELKTKTYHPQKEANIMKRQQTLIWIAMLGVLFMMEATSFGEERVTVIIEKGTLVFSPQEVTIEKGDSIRWNNKAE